MNSSTIWQVRDDSEGRTILEQRVTGIAVQGNSSLLDDAGYITAAIAGALTVILMFQPWLTATGSNGRLSADAFGRIDGATAGFDAATRGITGWTQAGDGQPSISGAWAILAALAAVVTITALVMYLRTRSVALAYLIPASAAATAVFVLANLLYLNGQAPDFRALVDGSRGSGGGLIGMFLDSNTSEDGTRQIASAGLDAAALLCGATAVGGAVAAVASGLHKHAWYTVGLVPIEQDVAALPAGHTWR